MARCLDLHAEIQFVRSNLAGETRPMPLAEMSTGTIAVQPTAVAYHARKPPARRGYRRRFSGRPENQVNKSASIPPLPYRRSLCSSLERRARAAACAARSPLLHRSRDGAGILRRTASPAKNRRFLHRLRQGFTRTLAADAQVTIRSARVRIGLPIVQMRGAKLAAHVHLRKRRLRMRPMPRQSDRTTFLADARPRRRRPMPPESAHAAACETRSPGTRTPPHGRIPHPRISNETPVRLLRPARSRAIAMRPDAIAATQAKSTSALAKRR